MKRWIVCIALTLTGSLVVNAQERQPGRTARAAQETLIERVSRQLAEALELTDAQRPQFEAIVARVKDQEKELADTHEIFEEMRAARDAEDYEKLKELRSRLRDRGKGTRQVTEQLLNDVEPMLTEDQKSRLADFRSSAGRRELMNNQRERGASMVRLLRSELKLRPDQESTFDELAVKLREGVDSREHNVEETRAIARRMREAEEAGDQARADELRQRLEELRGQADTETRPVEEFVRELEPILDEEQVRTLRQARARFGIDDGDDREATAERRLNNDPRTLFRAVRRLELSAQQRGEVKELEKSFREEMRAAGREREARQKVADKVHGDVMAVLNDDQKAELEELLAKAPQRAGDRLREGDGPGGFRRGAREGQPGDERGDAGAGDPDPQDDEPVDEPAEEPVNP